MVGVWSTKWKEGRKERFFVYARPSAITIFLLIIKSRMRHRWSEGAPTCERSRVKENCDFHTLGNSLKTCRKSYCCFYCHFRERKIQMNVYNTYRFCFHHKGDLLDLFKEEWIPSRRQFYYKYTLFLHSP